MSFPKDPNGNILIHLDAPSEPDGKPVVVTSPSPEGWMTWITSRGDDLAPTPPATGRGEGTKLSLSFTQAETKVVDVGFLEPTALHDGQFFWDPTEWDNDDEFSFSAVIPGTSTVANAGAGNCNLVDVGGYNVLVPAAGDGSHDVDLGKAQPVVPATGDGYWEVDEDTGLVTPSATPGQSDWHLLDVQVESFFIKRLGMGNPLGVFDIDVYKAEWVSQAWKLRLSVVRGSSGSGTCGGWLMMFRGKST